jgi:Arc/MetJ family transcription regulator
MLNPLIWESKLTIIGSMKTTIDIPDDVLKETLRNTGARTKRDAVVGGLREFNRRQRVDRLLAKLGKSTTFMTHQQLMDMRMERGKYRETH